VDTTSFKVRRKTYKKEREASDVFAIISVERTHLRTHDRVNAKRMRNYLELGNTSQFAVP
jgi:hypothetical protein